jgi:hypothetical protein
VPDLPAPEDLYASLAEDPDLELLGTSTGQMLLEFSGTVQITPELTVQNLTKDVTVDTGWPDPPWALNFPGWQAPAGVSWPTVSIPPYRSGSI